MAVELSMSGLLDRVRETLVGAGADIHTAHFLLLDPATLTFGQVFTDRAAAVAAAAANKKIVFGPVVVAVKTGPEDWYQHECTAAVITQEGGVSFQRAAASAIEYRARDLLSYVVIVPRT